MTNRALYFKFPLTIIEIRWRQCKWHFLNCPAPGDWTFWELITTGMNNFLEDSCKGCKLL